MDFIKFYAVEKKEYINAPKKLVKYETLKNGRKVMTYTPKGGRKYYKFLPNA